MVIFMLLYKVCLIQAHCVLCSCIVFKLIVYGRVHVLYSSSLCMVVFMHACIVFKLIMYGRVPMLCLCIVYIQAHCVWSCSFIVFGFIMCVFMLFA